jgi:putative addiction module killer protein
MEPIRRTAEEYVTEDGRSPFREWLSSRKLDGNARGRIRLRISRIEENGNYGDCAPAGDGAFELRFIGKGPGYRLYFGIDRNSIILLVGGDKRAQKADIKKVRAY